MENKVYTCPQGKFSSYLAAAFTSFVEYKVNVSGCVPESFIPELCRFDSYCLDHPETDICLKAATVHGFLKQRTIKIPTLKRVESILRSFGKYMVLVLRVQDAYVLPKIIKRRWRKNFVPYIFSLEGISALFTAADSYQLKLHNKPTVNIENCMRCIIKLLYCTGMRVPEACHLKVSDVDLDNRVIYIHHAKNDKHRIVTISSSLFNSIQHYLAESAVCGHEGIYFFHSGSALNDGRISSKCVYSYFRKYLRQAGIEHRGTGFGPRLHDLRVTFAVHSLKQLTEKETDVNPCLTYLSAYMGHQPLQETQDYPWLCSDLFESTLSRMEDYNAFISEIFEEKAGGCDA